MSQLAKTGSYIGVALLASILAYISRPAPATFEQDDLVGKPIFATFSDPTGAKSLRMVSYNENLAKLEEFEVRQIGGRWVLPSHSNYPADAENRIRDAAAEFVGLKIIGTAPTEKTDLSVYGVLEPNDENRQRAAKGIGTLLEMQDAEDDKHQLIVGNAVQGAESQHYIRLPQQNTVYIAKVDMDKFPRKFEEWINRNLLDINTWDIKNIVLKDYSFQILATPTGRVQPRYEQRLQVTVHEENGEWKLDELLEYREDDKQLHPSQLAEGEQLNKERLNQLRDALSDLTIVDVQRKPSGLKDDLTADADILQNVQNAQSLMDKGFFPVQIGESDKVELLSSDGEVLVRMKNGLEYVLRFGNIAGGDQEGEQAQLNRYLFVSARVNEELIPEPDLEDLPAEQGAAAADQPDADAEARPAETNHQSPSSSTDDPSTTDSSASSAPESIDKKTPGSEAASEIAGDASQDRADRGADGQAENEPPQTSGEAADESSSSSSAPDRPADDQAASDADSSATSSAASSPADSTPPAEDATPSAEQGESQLATTDDSASQADEQEELKRERERITRENQRKLDEYNDKVAEAETKKNELNYRFAEWYYVIPEDVFKKIHLNRSDLIQVDENAAKAGTGIQALRSLQQGLDVDLPDDTGTGSTP